MSKTSILFVWLKLHCLVLPAQSSGWEVRALQLDPRTPSAPSNLNVTLEPAVTIPGGSLVEVSLPGFTKESGSATFEVFPSSFADAFAYDAVWDLLSSTLQFRLLSSWVASEQVSFICDNYQFKLPDSSQLNSNEYTVTVYNSAHTTVLMQSASFLLVDQVLPDIEFVYSSVSIVNISVPSPERVIVFTISLNRVLYGGQKLFLKLPSYRAVAPRITVGGSGAGYLVNSEVTFDASTNTMRFDLNLPIFFDSTGSISKSFKIPGILLPDAQYKNDPSLLAWVDDGQRFPVKFSQPFDYTPGQMGKTFEVSSLKFSPQMDMLFTIAPSVFLSENTEVEISLLGGFSKSGDALIALTGADADVFAWTAWWNDTSSSIRLVVGAGKVLVASAPIEFTIGASQQFVFPRMLSENDGVVRIQTNTNSIIFQEPFKRCDSIGEAKNFTDALVSFSPAFGGVQSAISLAFSANTAILAGSNLRVHLGGFGIIVTPFVKQNLVLFEGRLPLNLINYSGGVRLATLRGWWDPLQKDLTVTVPRAVPPQTPISFTMPLVAGSATGGTNFTLPLSLDLERDLSLFADVFASGINTPQYLRIVTPIQPIIPKTFFASRIAYGPSVWSLDMHPRADRLAVVNFLFMPSFDLLAGAVIVLHLPGFQSVSNTSREIRVTAGNVSGSVIDHGSWDQEHEVMLFPIDLWPDAKLEANSMWWVQVADQLVLPSGKLADDESLLIEVNGTQRMLPERIKSSTAIQPFVFDYSRIELASPTPGSLTSVNLTFQSVVVIPDRTMLQLDLPGFVLINTSDVNPATRRLTANILPSVVVQFVDSIVCYSGGYDLVMIACGGVWFPESSTLGVVFDKDIKAREIVLVAVGPVFLVPPAVNPGAISLQVLGLINPASVMHAPSLGTGPFVGQTFCVTTLANPGVRYHLNPEFKLALAVLLERTCPDTPCTSSDWVRDVCASVELERCGCEAAAAASANLVLSGYLLEQAMFGDVKVVDGTDCGSVGTPYVQVADLKSPVVSSDGSWVDFGSLRILLAGEYSVCVSDTAVASLVARPDCVAPLVQFNYACFAHCPVGFVPAFGICAPTPESFDIPIAFDIAVIYDNADALGLANLPNTDSTYQYFEFITISNLQTVLFEANSTRFQINQLDRGDNLFQPTEVRPQDLVLISVVLEPSGGAADVRSTGELFALWSALVADLNSVVYLNPFFESLSAVNVPGQGYGAPIEYVEVRTCPGMTGYFAVCPLTSSPSPASPTSDPSWYFVGAIVGGLVGGIVGAAALVGVYRMDSDRSKNSRKNISAAIALVDQDNDFSIIKIAPPDSDDPKNANRAWYTEVESLDWVGRAQFAEDWLEGKLLDEDLFLRPRRRPKKDAPFS